MNLYNKTLIELEEQKEVYKLYKVFNHFKKKANDNYSFYSKTLEHHIYYLIKKLIQTLNYYYDVSIGNSRNKELFYNIDMLIQYLKIDNPSFNIYRHEYFLDYSIQNIIEQKDLLTTPNISKLLRVDRTIFHGGYGLPSIYKDLMNELVLFTKIDKINTNQIIDFLETFKSYLYKYGYSKYRSSLFKAGEVFVEIDHCKYQINKNIFSNFSKYDIANTLEHIIDDSENRKTELITSTVDSYNLSRKIILNSLESSFTSK